MKGSIFFQEAAPQRLTTCKHMRQTPRVRKSVYARLQKKPFAKPMIRLLPSSLRTLRPAPSIHPLSPAAVPGRLMN